MCDLCLLVQRKAHAEKIIYEDQVCMIVTCRTCHVPMVVLNRHATVPKCWELEHMLKVVRELDLKGNIDFKRRTIKDHYHFHIR